MADYRLYCLDGDGKIGFADWIQAATDDDAILKAQRLKPDAVRCEIWRRKRLVAKLNGSGRFEMCWMGLYDDQKRTIGSVLESRESERKREDEILRRLLGAKANSHTETLECDPVIPIALPHDQLGRRR